MRLVKKIIVCIIVIGLMLSFVLGVLSMNLKKVYALEKEELNDQYSFDDDIAVCIYDNLTINITELLKQ